MSFRRTLTLLCLALGAAPLLAADPSARLIELGSLTIDTSRTPSGGLAPDGRYLVKLPAPASAEERAALGAASAVVYTYLPHHAYLVRVAEGGPATLASRLPASWISPWGPEQKIDRRIAALTGREPQEAMIVMVHLFPDADLEVAAGRLAGLGAGSVVGVGRGPRFGRVRMVMSARELVAVRGALAGTSDVFYVDVEPRLALMNDTTIWVGQSGPSGAHTTPVFAHGIHGEGQVVGIIDTGLDADLCWFEDTANGLPAQNVCNGGTTIDAAQRKVLAVDFLYQGDCSGGISAFEWDDHGHGSHVAGTVGGDRSTPITHDGADGMAPGAKLVIQDGGYAPDDCGDLPGLGCPMVSLYPFFQQAYTQGARLHTNSYGDNENDPTQNDYTAATEDVDQFTWDHEDFLIFFAAGNSGPGPDSVGSPSTAKSCVSVGATLRGSAAENLASFSSCGYTDDGRIKPEVVIPGDSIVSAASDGDVGSGNCGSFSLSGTSMASPAAAGLAALVRQYYTDGYHPSGVATPADALQPSAALVRATLVNSARNMSGPSLDIPARCQAWGRITLDDALYFPADARQLVAHDDPGFPTGSTESRDLVVTVTSPGTALKATLAWSDYPSTPAAGVHLVNDLDLTVIAPDGTTIWKGNVFAQGQSTTGGNPDRKNTLEQVLLGSPTQVGDYTIRVTAVAIPNGPQPYALAVTGPFGAPPGTADDHVVGQGLGQPNPNQVKVATSSGGATPVDFLAYAAGSWGVNVAAGDVTGDDTAEILTGPGPGAVFGPQVRAFDRTGSPVAKVNFFAYGTLRYGANVGAAALDASAAVEMLTGAGPGDVFGPHVRGFGFDGTSVAPLPGLSFFAYATLRYGVNAEAGSIELSGRDDVVTGPGPGVIFGPQVRGFRYTGGGVAAIGAVNFNAFPTPQYGANVACAQVDGDAPAEVAAAAGPGAALTSQILGFDVAGAVAPLPGFDVTPFPSYTYGARLALGDLNGDGQADLSAGAGRDPAADSQVRAYAYSGSALALLPSPFFPFAGAQYGVNVGVGALEY